ncbi:hypothetical protein BJY01DRAFT_164076 [Aspergillus pseudoustus]|uniref:Mid2 domain-containing protein n=1 Tax=Aspergillus pseudoustus TaxID=1810923 RepID=A0ABR4IAD7_9EURO
MSGKFTFPTEDLSQFIVADQVNVTWDVVAPFISLYESCGTEDRILQDQVTNNYSYVWTATRTGYVESGCNFMLKPFTTGHEAYGNNVNSVTFGVSKRYTDDPAPVSYNFVNETSSSTLPSTTTSATSTLATVASPETPAPTTTETSQSGSSHGLSKADRIGIGLGVPLGVILIAVAVGGFFIYRRRKFRQRDERKAEAIPAVQADDGLAPLPTFRYKDPNHARLSMADSIATTPSELSSDHHYQRAEGMDRPPSELMSIERVELA